MRTWRRMKRQPSSMIITRSSARGNRSRREFSMSSLPFYQSFSGCLRRRLGGKVYGVSMDAGFTCPNVDGAVAVGGCVYCDNRSFSPNRRLPRRTVKVQVEHGIEVMRRRYGADKFLAYFQAGTNTYASVDKLKRLYDEGLQHPAIVGLLIGTLPDCVP